MMYSFQAWMNALRRICADPRAADRPPPRRDLDLRVHPGPARIHHGLRPAPRPEQADVDRLARVVHGRPRHCLGAADGRSDADRIAGGRLLRRGAAQDRVRADRGRGSRMSTGGLEPAAAACLFPPLGALVDGAGGVVLFARDIRSPEQLAELTASLPGLLIAVDEEGGDVTRLEAATGSSFPGNLALGAVDDEALTRRVGAAIGGELAAAGVNFDLAPVADVIVDPANPIVGVRSFGSDPALVSRHVAAFVEGLQSVGVAACAKHFPGHGESLADSHLELPTVETDRETLFARALPPFAAAVEAGVRGVMTAHIRFAALADRPATVSAEVIGLLRSELGFEGLVITDALEMRAISGTVGLEEGAVRTLAAGADALCLGADVTREQVQAVQAAIVHGVPEERLREAAARVAESAAWASSPRPHHDLEAGAEAARRALRVEGDVSLNGEPLVVELRPEATIAAGEARHGLGGTLVREGEQLPPLDDLRRVVIVVRDAHRHAWQRDLAHGRGGALVREGEQLPPLDDLRRVVIVVRDAHRHAWQRDLVPARTLVVETGVPEWRPPDARGWIATYGAGRVN